ncbi:MAG: hypothetical protein ACI843_001370 [Psychrobacter glaciei]|jgi:hypothetical protein
MTPSIDPSKTQAANGQTTGTYDWNALISSAQSAGKPSPNPVMGCLNFLNRFITHESLYGDSEGAREMSKVLLLLQSVDSPVSYAQQQQTRKSYEYTCAYLEILNETEAPFDVCFEFERLCHVLETLIRIRQQTDLGVQCSFGHLHQQLTQASSFGTFTV